MILERKLYKEVVCEVGEFIGGMEMNGREIGGVECVVWFGKVGGGNK